MVHLTKQTTAKEPARKELMQCQYCFKSRLSGGATLSRCAGCQVAWYCVSSDPEFRGTKRSRKTSLKSRECQTKHWPIHKPFCKVNRSVLTRPPEDAERMKLLRAFTAKHRPTLVQLGRFALDLVRHPENWQEYVLVIVVSRRPDSKKAETAFKVLDIGVETPDFWGDNKASILVQFEYLRDVNRRTDGGVAGGFYTAVFMDLEDKLQNIVGVGYAYDEPDQGFNEDNWRDVMMDRMNRGIVL